MYVYMYMYVYIYMYVYVCIYIYIYMYMYMYIYMYVCMYVCMYIVGYKIPTAEVLNRINDSARDADLKGRLRPDSYGSRASSSTPTATRQTASGFLREPDSADDFNSK